MPSLCGLLDCSSALLPRCWEAIEVVESEDRSGGGVHYEGRMMGKNKEEVRVWLTEAAMKVWVATAIVAMAGALLVSGMVAELTFPPQAEAASTTTRGEFMAAPALIRSAIRAQMTRLEPSHLLRASVAERIAHHVQSSAARARFINAQTKSSGSTSSWASSITTVPGGYAMSLSLGDPVQTFTVLADTGSDLTWVQSSDCNPCFRQPGSPYQRSKSSSYEALGCASKLCAELGTQSACGRSGEFGSTGHDEHCRYEYEYGDESITTGLFSTETITLKATDGTALDFPRFRFGLGLGSDVDFEGVDGLLGLGQGPISFTSQLGAKYGRVFQYCLQTFQEQNHSSPIIFGASAVPSTGIAYTPLQSTSQSELVPTGTFWFLDLQSLSVDGEKLQVVSNSKADDSRITIIDSGTTVSQLDFEIYHALRASLVSKVAFPLTYGGVPSMGTLDLCFNTTEDRHPVFPVITFNFRNADWELPQTNSFISLLEDGSLWCLAILPSTQDMQIFGNFQQQNFIVVYDQPNARLGWVAAACDAI